MKIAQCRTQSGSRIFLYSIFAIFAVCICSVASAADPLPSWNEGPAKKAILEFVVAVTDKNSKDYVEPGKRIATFDNDGTLWVEYPMYTQVLFTFDRVKKLAPQHPEWKTKQPFKALLAGDMKTVGASGMKGITELIMASHAGMTGDEFEQEATQWLASARHPKLGCLYKECIYQPQLELLAYLRANEFKTFIVSGGGIQFMRPMTMKAYGIPPWQVVGSSIVRGWQVGACPHAEDRLHRRQGRQAGGHLWTHWCSPDPGLWQCRC